MAVELPYQPCLVCSPTTPGRPPRHRHDARHHRTQRLRHRHRPHRQRLCRQGQERLAQPLPDPGSPAAARSDHSATHHRRGIRRPRRIGHPHLRPTSTRVIRGPVAAGTAAFTCRLDHDARSPAAADSGEDGDPPHRREGDDTQGVSTYRRRSQKSSSGRAAAGGAWPSSCAPAAGTPSRFPTTRPNSRRRWRRPCGRWRATRTRAGDRGPVNVSKGAVPVSLQPCHSAAEIECGTHDRTSWHVSGGRVLLGWINAAADHVPEPSRSYLCAYRPAWCAHPDIHTVRLHDQGVGPHRLDFNIVASTA